MTMMTTATDERITIDASMIADEVWFNEAIHVCEAAAQGDFEPRILHCDRETLAGRLGIAINDLLDRADAFVRESAATLDHASRGEFYRRVLPNGMVGAYRQAADIINAATGEMARHSKALANHEARRQELASELQSEVGTVVHALAESATGLRRTAQQLASLSQETAEAADQGSQSAEIASQHVRHVTEVGQSLVASEKNVENLARNSRDVAQSAVRDAARTSELMKQLSQANRCIGDVVSLIANIARQTNLLALNASIEASRAGEAGRGFAVVAVEVKKLSEQTATATKRIAAEVKAVTSASDDTAQAIDAVADKIQQLNSLAGSIDVAIRQQLRITDDIQHRLADSDQCVTSTASSIAKTGTAADRTKQAADGLLGSADNVSSQTSTLHVAVENFLKHIRG